MANTSPDDSFETKIMKSAYTPPPKSGDYTPTARELWWLTHALCHVAGIGFGFGLGSFLQGVIGG